MIPCPCYDVKSHTDCPNRTATCHSECPEWKEYLKKRDRIYAENKRKFEEKGLEIAYETSRHKRLERIRGKRKH